MPLVLAVDDDPEQLALVCAAATRAGGLKILTANSAEAALDQLAMRRGLRLAAPELILLDVRLPKISGLDLVRLLRAEPSLRDVPIIMFTSLMYSRHETEAIAAGATAFYHKPMRYDELVRMMSDLPLFLTHPPVGPIARGNSWTAPPPGTRSTPLVSNEHPKAELSHGNPGLTASLSDIGRP